MSIHIYSKEHEYMIRCVATTVISEVSSGIYRIAKARYLNYQQDVLFNSDEAIRIFNSNPEDERVAIVSSSEITTNFEMDEKYLKTELIRFN